MHSIGSFSKINRVTPKSLRHYDAIGLLKPALVDPQTGYRYYAASQLEEMGQILLLKELGFRLSEIRPILDQGGLSPERLKAKERQLIEELHQQQTRLGRLQQLLQSFQGEPMPSIKIQALPAVLVASLRTKVESYDSFFSVVPEMAKQLQSMGVVCREPAYCFTLFLDDEYREKDLKVEICEAVTAKTPTQGSIQFKEIPAVPHAACLLHQGPYATLGQAYNRLFQWMEKEGWELEDHPRESYLDGIWNQESPEDWLTELQFPVRKKAA